MPERRPRSSSSRRRPTPGTSSFSAEGDVSVNEPARPSRARPRGRWARTACRPSLFTAKWICRDGRASAARTVQIHRGRLAERGRTFDDRTPALCVTPLHRSASRSKGLEDLRRLIAEQRKGRPSHDEGSRALVARRTSLVLATPRRPPRGGRSVLGRGLGCAAGPRALLGGSGHRSHDAATILNGEGIQPIVLGRPTPAERSSS
ncbi:hypothetical protein QJS66_02295 [Kocuria rhizophila]|nr:hypothetical protein QJS66_02295 [Kocuria rhizophila]